MSRSDEVVGHDEGINLVYWPVGSALTDRPFSEHLRIAQAGDFSSLAVSPATFKSLRASGLSVRDILDLAGEHGVALGPLDGLVRWVDQWHPAEDSPENRALRGAFDVSMEEALDIASALEMNAAVAVGFFDVGAIATDRLVDAFGRLCDLSQDRGIHIDLEFIPLWGIPELPLAWEIVQGAGRSNSGICVDTWHLQMGTTDLERDIDLLNIIPGDFLRSVQLADADLGSSWNLLSPAEVTRKFAGEGELEIGRILAAVAGRGGLRNVGPEILGGRLAGHSPDEIGAVAGRTTRAALSAIGSWPRT